MASVFIRDGYTLTATAPPKGPAPGLTFVYRPCLSDELQDFLHAPRKSGKEATQAAVKLLAEHVVSWDVLDDQGGPVPVTEKVLRQLWPHLLDAMVDHVCGYTLPEQEGDAKN